MLPRFMICSHRKWLTAAPEHAGWPELLQFPNPLLSRFTEI
jgi:hypothetical protein